MEHAKKLMLVEPKMYKASMREKTLSKLDEDIESTLNSDLEDGEKAARYIESLRRYKYYGDSGIADKKGEKSNVESEILATISIEDRHRAKRILEHLKRDTSFKIGDEGEIIYKQQKIDKSHVGDLLNDVLQKKSTEEGPLGWKEFSSTLYSSGVPKNLISNPARGKQQITETVRRKARQRQSTPTREWTLGADAKRAKRVVKKPKWFGYDEDNDEL
jgi:hypothetical protein